MNLDTLEPGDLIYAASHIYNDGGIPGVAEQALLAAPGTRGVIVETGHLKEAPERMIFLVRFENEALDLGPPIGCWPEELSMTLLEPMSTD